ncbi:MAG TPA: hypothetical protein VJ965_05495 [Anaerolineales bacterium]|nr:hypothetical protein [Anaerolineales bacterium]
MPVQTPIERAYYYECSYGKFRLTYHIPLTILEQMVANKDIAKTALRDYPDGIDLDCSTPDYDEFEKRYKYRPPYEPDPLCRTFKTVFSSLEDWDTFNGTGFLSASYLEELIPQVEDTLKEWEKDLAGETALPLEEASVEAAAPPDPRQQVIQQAKQQELEDHILKAIPLKAITPEAPQSRQELTPKMGGGEAAPSVFTRAHKGERRPDDDR